MKKARLMVKGYTKLVLLVNIPNKTLYLTVILWDEKKFLGGDEPLGVGDCVLAKYHYNGNFKQLDEVTKMIRFDICPICWSNLEAGKFGQLECNLIQNTIKHYSINILYVTFIRFTFFRILTS